MLIQLSDEVQRDVETAIRTKLGASLVVNAYDTAVLIRERHAISDVTLEDIAKSIAKIAVQRGCAVEFGKGKPETADA